MEKDKFFSEEFEELKKELKKKKIRKYTLIALAAVIVVSTAVGLNIENKDSKLPDGQGNIITNEETADDKNQAEQNDSQSEIESSSEEKNTSQGSETSSASKGNKPSSSSSIKPSSGSTKPSSKDLAVDNSKDPTASNGGNSAFKPDEEEKVTVTISIRCDTLSRDMSKLTNPAIAGYIPSNGIILNTTTYKGTTDNTVFDVLNTVCRNNGIQLESKYTPLYESYYVMGINYLYEFDGGPQSGWMYRVNGWFPNYGCSSYYLSDGDVIEWLYTCEGLGTDVGAPPFKG